MKTLSRLTFAPKQGHALVFQNYKGPKMTSSDQKKRERERERGKPEKEDKRLEGKRTGIPFNFYLLLLS